MRTERPRPQASGRALILALALALAAPAPAAAQPQRTPAEEVSVLIARGQYTAAERIALAQLRKDAAAEGPRRHGRRTARRRLRP
ncbi:MAG: hypothetical protein ACK59B_18635, partial [Alphaproteobacteria bacterium]